MNPLSPAATYRQQINEAKTLLAQLQQKRTRLGVLRLLSLLIPAFLCYYFLPQQPQGAFIAIIAGFACLLFLVAKDTDNNHLIHYQERLIALNEDELKVLDYQYSHRDDGKTYEPAVHTYAADLDLFGPYSLYQYINRCESEQGKALLAQRLLDPVPAQDIQPCQQAAAEMAPQYEWRQALQNYGRQTPVQQVTERRVNNWLAQPEEILPGKYWPVLVKCYPLLPLASIALVALEIIPVGLFNALFLFFLLLSSALTRKIGVIYQHVSRIEPEIATLQQELQHIETKQWQSPYLRALQQKIKGGEQPAYKELLELKKILNRFDYRISMSIIFLNPLLLWDIRQAMQLQQWKRRNKQLVADWFTVIAEMEVLNTIATLQYNHPQWTMPVLSTNYFELKAAELGHPLIDGGKRVNNPAAIEGVGQVMLITGSNMAGKSTYLRSLGVNTVLAMMGAPVCAASFVVSPVRLISSMRIADNLAENTSTFYAELKKLQQIIEKVNRHEKIFILLDEILRGTNSLDRHTGSRALIQQLIKEKAIAVVATHDVELAALSAQYPNAVHNYHFDVQVSNEELYFDYRLKTGVCQSMNASILMRKIGIEMDQL